MPVKIRLSRHGKKRLPYYHIVIADSRAPRDGKLIERVGSYNPNTNPATIELDFDRALDWLLKGAQPTDTCRAILSYKGVLMKKHLVNGIKKGALTEEIAEERFSQWIKEKEQKIEAKRNRVLGKQEEESALALEEEARINEARAAEIAKRNAEFAAEAEKASGQQEEISEEVADEVHDQGPVAGAKIEETPGEKPANESSEEAPVKETPAEEPAKESPEEEPVKEVPAEDPAKESPEEAPAKEMPAEDPAKESPEEVPAVETPGEEPARETPEEIPAAKKSGDKKPSGEKNTSQGGTPGADKSGNS